MGEGIAIEELDGPVQDANDAAEDAEQDRANKIALGCFLLLSNGADLTQEVDDCNHKTTKTDASETVGHGAFESSPRGSRGQVVRAEIPRSIDAGYGGVDGVLEPFGDPVGRESNEDKQTDDLALPTTTSASAAGGVISRLILDVNGNQSDRVPGAESSAGQTSNRADQIDMAIALGDVNGGLQHQGAEWNAGNPADEGDDHEYGEEEKDNATGPVVPRQHVNGGDEAEDDVEDAGDPNELLGECAGQPDVGIAENNGYAKAEDEEDNGVGGKAEAVGAIVNSAAIEALGMS